MGFPGLYEKAEGWPPDPLMRLEAIIPPHRARIDALSGERDGARGDECHAPEDEAPIRVHIQRFSCSVRQP